MQWQMIMKLNQLWKICNTEVYQIPYQAVYLINKQPLQVVDQHKYLPNSQIIQFHDMVPAYPDDCHIK